MPEKLHVSVIILNWNGWKDTVECLETVLKSNYDNFHILLVDNHSSDNSVDMINKWAVTNNFPGIDTNFPDYVYPLVDKPIDLFEMNVNVNDGKSYIPIAKILKNKELREKSIIFIKNRENIGFAAGNNLGINIAGSIFRTKYFLLLNNDTVIEESAIRNIVSFLEVNSTVGAATSAIKYYSNPNLIHNLGGRLTRWGAARYYTSSTQLKKKKVSFLTGCSLMIKKEIIEKWGLLSENFFHGEEDFDYSFRLKKNGIEVACAQESIVYHKISIASDNFYKKGSLKRKFIHIFYRVIDMKFQMNRPKWQVWRFLVYFYVFFWLILKYRVRIYTTLIFIQYLNYYTNLFNDGKKQTIEKIIQEVDL